MIEDQLRTISYNIRRLRQAKNVSATELAESTGITSQYIRSIEREGHNFSVCKLLLIANSLGVSINEMFRGIRTDDNS